MTDTPPTAPPRRQMSLRWILTWALRGGLAGLIGWLCVWSLQGIAALGERETAATSPTSRAFNPLDIVHSQDLSAGVWQFLDEFSQVSAATLTPSDAQRKILQPPAPGIVPDRRLAEKFHAIVQMLRDHGQTARVGDLWQLSLLQHGFHVVVFARDPAASQLVAIRWIIPLGAGRSWFLEQTAAPRDVPAAYAATAILPSTIRSRVLAQRSGADGKTWCQFLVVESSLVELLDELRRQGWQIDAPMNEKRPGLVTIYLTRKSASYWMVSSLLPDTKSLRVLLLKDEAPADSHAPQISVGDDAR